MKPLGRAIRAGNATDLFQLIQQEDALVWQTHPPH